MKFKHRTQHVAHNGPHGTPYQVAQNGPLIIREMKDGQ